ncbi:MAG: hypothetical protein RL328_2500 [Acidobacteriota bacterium]|jgi:spore coat protein CotH
MDSADWRKLHDNYKDKKTTYAAELSWRGLTLRSVGIHTRGSGSLNPIKPGLAIEFDRFVPGQSLLGLQSLILRNMWGDPSTLHEYLTMRVLERLGMPFQRTAHVRVMVNGEYVGLYQLAEPLDSTYLRSRFGEDTGELYEMQGGKGYHFQYWGDDPAVYVPSLFGPKTPAASSQGAVIADWARAINLSVDSEFVHAMDAYVDL